MKKIDLNLEAKEITELENEGKVLASEVLASMA